MMSDRKKAEVFLLAKHLSENPNEASQADIAKGVGYCLSMVLVMMSAEMVAEPTATPYAQTWPPDIAARQRGIQSIEDQR